MRPDIQVIGARGVPNVEGGAEKNAETLFPMFVDAGYQVELVGIKRFCPFDRFRGMRITRLPTVDILKTDKVFYNFFALVRACFTRPRIVHLQCLNSALFLVFYKLAGLKVVMRYGSSDYEFDKWGFVERQILKLCEYQIRFANHVITVSDTFRHALVERHGLSRVTVIPNGLDPVEVSAEAEALLQSLGLTDKRFVLSVGRVTADKSFETLVEAHRRLANEDVELIVAGGIEPGYGDKFTELADKRVRFIGRVDRDLLSALYSNCRAYVNCSRHEGLSNAVLEALSYRAPVVLSDIPANNEMKLPSVNYFETGNADALADTLADVLATPQRYVCDTDQFASWDEVFARTCAVYANVLPGHFNTEARSQAEASMPTHVSDKPSPVRG